MNGNKEAGLSDAEGARVISGREHEDGYGGSEHQADQGHRPELKWMSGDEDGKFLKSKRNGVSRSSCRTGRGRLPPAMREESRLRLRGGHSVSCSSLVLDSPHGLRRVPSRVSDVLSFEIPNSACATKARTGVDPQMEGADSGQLARFARRLRIRF
jgi:hypothetical protein